LTGDRRRRELPFGSVELGKAVLDGAAALGWRDVHQVVEHRAQPPADHRLHAGFGDLVGARGQEFFPARSIEEDPGATSIVDDQPDR